MIRVSVCAKSILQRLGAKAAIWSAEAEFLTEKNRISGRHIAATKIWSRVKMDLVALQHSKCAYCERLLGANGAEATVDHFRPKGSTHRFDLPPEPVFDAGGNSPVGYFLLSYDLDNYLAACRECNIIKDDYFPTRHARHLVTADPKQLRQEDALLIDPADEDDLDPTLLINWRGFLPEPANISGLDRLRALVTINLMRLAREDLVRERGLVLAGVRLAYERFTATKEPKMEELLNALCSESSPHAGCARAFRRLCENDPASAEAVFDEVVDLLTSIAS